MKDTYGKKTYKCKCGELADQFVWDSEVTKYIFKCNKCDRVLDVKQLKVKQAAQSAAIRTPTKNR